MADAKITALDAIDAIVSADIAPMVDDPGGTPVTKKFTFANLVTFLATAFSTFRFAGSTNTLTLQQYVATVIVAGSATTGKEAAIAIPANFLAMFVAVHVTVASTNAVNLVDIGDDVDTDAFCDGLAIAVNSTGFKGVFPCNGVRGNPGGTANGSGSLATPDEVELVLSGDPGATGPTIRLTFFGVAGA